MIYNECELVDSNDPDILTINSFNFMADVGNKIAEVLNNYGFKARNRSNNHIDIVIKLNTKLASLYFYDPWHIVYDTKFTESCSSFSKPNKHKQIIGSLTIDMKKLKDGLIKKEEDSKLRKNNKNVWKFKEVLFRPYIEGKFNSCFEKCEIQARPKFSYRVKTKIKGYSAYIYTKEMTQLEFGQIDFDEVQCSLSFWHVYEVYKASFKLGELETVVENIPSIIKELAPRVEKFLNDDKENNKLLNELVTKINELKYNINESRTNFHLTTKDIKW